ncbi:general secretion pathway protein GspB [Vibrio sp. RE86]|uniref:general secretion pathway protein GspB n=1 Tax=Vibrio sp. RE86 TaxID=2607605 RepID=UPI001493B4D8|nr:general secretion pathway protein GspB [Vibrio sp. RE86]NOH81765.1 general secretion pathway protein GspB [Vibrio sp. RE86]
MSKVMRALESSESQYNASAPYAVSYYPAQVELPRQTKLVSLVLLALSVPLGVAVAMAVKTYHEERSLWFEKQSQQPIISQVPFEFTVTEWPEPKGLVSTYKPFIPPAMMVVEQTTQASLSESASEQAPPPKAANKVRESDLLKGLDLSELSPELAHRFESAIKTTSDVDQVQRDDISYLEHQTERWSGELPAMNFQTHVYSNRPDKRWVKINGIEYNEGETMKNGVELISIEQHSTLIQFRGELIEIPALYDWQG